ncbi:tetratricopeptide repeat protein [Gymnodinialimonas ulvae]|uniref:tetratricopeptide repeat protein n=1 Tax=Gymnodinialimonas ulvae TaxID=3126504 RepID=UPI00309E33E4
MKLPVALRTISLVSALALMAGAATAQDDGAAERAAAVEEALAAFDALAQAAPDTETGAAAQGEDEVAAEADEASEGAVEEALAAFAALAAETAARAEEEATAERADAVGAARDAFAALAAETAARAEAEAQATRAEAVEDAQSAFAALTAEREAEAARQAAIAEAQAAFDALAAESAARAEARAALETCVATAGTPSAENFPSEEAQVAALGALREALPFCRDAARALPDEAGAAFFHLATAAQASGRHRRAVPLYEQAAEAGVAPALTRLGDYHNFGLRPVREDAEQAVDFYRQAAEAGDTAGTATLAFMYRLGRGVEQSGAEYLRLMEEAAERDYPFAQQNLAQTYLSGEGVPRDELEGLDLPNPRAAVPLFVTLANAGSAEAMQSLITLYSDGADGIAPSDFLRGGWVEMLAETGDPVGIAERGFLYEQGIGRPANPERAAADYVAALESGEVNIDTMRGTVNGQTPPWDRDTAIAFQTILSERGLYTMRIDGDVGPGTRRAADGLAASE